jgi:hypothetical protein
MEMLLGMMKRNRMKIVSKANPQKLEFFFQGEKGEWWPITSESKLSRSEYATTIQEKAADILRYIDNEYNPQNRGVDIIFEGSPDDFTILDRIQRKILPDANIHCYQETKIAVAGKIKSGKSTLIEEINHLRGEECLQTEEYGVLRYTNEVASIIWNEIPGIEIGKETVAKAIKTFDTLAEQELTAFVYCINVCKIEQLEEEFIGHVKEKYPRIKILIALTMSVGEEDDLIADQIGKLVGNIKAIPVLAKEYNTQTGIVAAYGLDKVAQYLFGGGERG